MGVGISGSRLFPGGGYVQGVGTSGSGYVCGLGMSRVGVCLRWVCQGGWYACDFTLHVLYL